MALSVKELQIGDWVVINENHPDCPFTRRVDIGDLSFFTKFAPIPLTAEILEKNGWRYYHIDSFGYPSDADWYFYNSSLSNRYAKISGKEKMTFLDCHIQYVHELQHALRLCGLNDLADNFKI